MRPKGSKDVLEARRRQAIGLLGAGHGVREVARIVGASPGSVVRWREAWLNAGDAGLCAKRHPGSKPRLNEEERQELVRMLQAGPRAHGYAAGPWTLRRIAELIDRTFGIKYHPSQVWRILRQMGWQPITVRRSSAEESGHAA